MRPLISLLALGITLPLLAEPPKYPVLPGALSPGESLAALRVRSGFKVELVAAEPLVQDPVDIAWGPDGRLWVVEMADYPLGLDGKGKPGGRVKVLTDTDGDGRYDRATLFLDNIAFPTGVMPWRKGALITAAPSLLFAEDTNGDGKADEVKPLFTGFGEGNQQHRVNSPRWGLDGWVYLANGDSDGKIRSELTGDTVDIRGRDLRVNPDTGSIEAITGRAQFGRNRDDWGNWFGCSNSRPMWHYILDDADLRRNTHLLATKAIREVPEIPGAAPVFPASRTVARFNDHDRANRFTSACGTNIYRDELLPGLYGNAFICEPVHNLVSRLVLEPDGVTFVGRRAPGEERAEFLTSTDGWFRPTAVHTGPDGALYVVDMYRQVIEHPQWIPPDWQKELDLRAGHDRGRIYRIVPEKGEPRKVPRLDKLDTKALVAAMDSPNGWQRDMVQQMLTWQGEHRAVEALRILAAKSTRPAARLQAYSTLQTLQAIEDKDLFMALSDSHPGVVRQVIRIARATRNEPFVAEMLADTLSSQPAIRLELAAALGDFAAGQALAKILKSPKLDEFTLTAALSSLSESNIDGTLTAAIALPWADDSGPMAEALFRMAAILGEPAALDRAVAAIGPPMKGEPPWKLAALTGLLDGLDARPNRTRPELKQVSAWLEQARALAPREDAAEPERVAAIRLLTRKGAAGQPDQAMFLSLLGPRHPPAVQEEALAALVRIGTLDIADQLLGAWKSYGPRLRPRVAETLASREAWAERFLTAIEEGKVPPGQVDAAASQRLLRSKNSSIRTRAEKQFATANADRAKLIDDYLAKLPKAGDVVRGRAVFAKNCAACHRLENEGHTVGPDLAMMTDKPPDWFLTAILDPNRAIEARYLEYIAVTEDGRSVSGVLTSETGVAVTLTGAEGKVQTLRRRDLESLSASGKSPMPEGLEREITPAMMADLFAFLAAQRR